MSETASIVDLRPACTETTRIAVAVLDDQLHHPSPCEEMTVGEVLGHLMGLALAFTPGAAGAAGQQDDAEHLDPAWRELLPMRLAALAAAWADPNAYDQPLEAGGVRMGGAEAAVVALDEVVVHGWDLAVATGQAYAVDDTSAAVVLGFAAASALPAAAPLRERLFGPVVAVPASSGTFERALGLAGRDPAWAPPRR